MSAGGAEDLVAVIQDDTRPDDKENRVPRT